MTQLVKSETAITSGGFEPSNMGELLTLADTLSRSSLIPGPLRGKPGDVAVILMHGRELGLTPMRALSEIYVVDGKPSASATLKVGLCVRHSNVCKYFRAIEVTERLATYETQRIGSEPVRFTYSIEDAARAGLTGRATWKAHPKQMLSARAKSILATMVYPDLVGNLYDPDEAQDIRESRRAEPESQPVIVVSPAPAPVLAPAPVPVALPEPEPTGSPTFVEAMRAISGASDIAALKGAAELIVRNKSILSDTESDNLRKAYTAKRASLGGAK